MIRLCDIVGQDAAIDRLARILSGDRRPHAYIFAGPTGVGRRTTAEALAAVLLCEQPRRAAGESSPPEPCGNCNSCRMLDAGVHGDFHPVSRESARFSADSRTRSSKMQELSISVVREFVIDPANRAAGQGRGRVFIIREAELMSIAAQNALLKTLEEPPPGVTLILICRSPEELLPTTRSRCSLVRLGPLPFVFVAERLTASGVEAAESRFWAAYTTGSVGAGLRLAESDLYAFKCDVVTRLAALTESVDADLGDLLVARAEALADRAVAADKQLARTLATRQAAGILLGLLASVYRDAMRHAAGGHAVLIHQDQTDAIARIAAAVGAVPCADIVAQMARYEQLLWRNVNAKTLWDNVMITCATGAPLEV